MGKKAKSARHDAKMKEKRAQKALKVARYRALAEGSNNSLKKRKKGSGRTEGRHPFGKCGNIGCDRCFVTTPDHRGPR